MRFHSFLFTLIILISCKNFTSKAQTLYNEGQVVLAGKIQNAKQKTIEIETLEYLGRNKYVARINDDGSFVLPFNTLGSHDNYLIFDNNLTRFFAGPNDSIYLTADSNDFKRTLKYSGDNAKFNQSLILFFEDFSSNIDTLKLLQSRSTATHAEFKSRLLNFSNYMCMSIDSIAKHIQPTEETIKWMETFIKYRNAEELFKFGKYNRDRLPLDYNDFIYDYIEPEIHDLKCSQCYEIFADNYFWYLVSSLEEFELAQNYFEEGNVYEAFNIVFKGLNNNISNKHIRELLLTKSLEDIFLDDNLIKNRSLVDSIHSAYSQLVQNSSLRSAVKRKIGETSATRSTIKDLMSLDFVGEIFLEINKKHNGKVLYVDIWGTWCSNCISEFPASNELYSSLREEPIEFVYLCCNSKEEKWKESIEKFGLHGSHYLLTKEQYSVLSAMFNYTGLPRYMIIDKEGIIVNENSNRPSDPVLKKELLKLINQ